MRGPRQVTEPPPTLPGVSRLDQETHVRNATTVKIYLALGRVLRDSRYFQIYIQRKSWTTRDIQQGIDP